MTVARCPRCAAGIAVDGRACPRCRRRERIDRVEARRVLRLWVENDWQDVPLEVGDGVAFDSALRHEVTRIDTGERITLVTHALDRPLLTGAPSDRGTG